MVFGILRRKENIWLDNQLPSYPFIVLLEFKNVDNMVILY